MNISAELKSKIINDYIASGNYTVGQKLPTVRQLAEQYNVSFPTIGKTIEVLTCEGWLTKRRGSGIYIAARQDKERTSWHVPRIGFVVHNMNETLGHRVLQGVEYIVRKKGAVLEVANSNFHGTEEHSSVLEMKERGVDGIVLYPTVDRENCENYFVSKELESFPIVVVDLYLPSMKRPHVIFDNFFAGRQITNHLLSLGKRRIVFLNYGEDLPHRAIADRQKGYERAIDDAGLSYLRVLSCGAWIQEGVKSSILPVLQNVVDELLSQGEYPDAIIAPTDFVAARIRDYLRCHGVKVPDDIIVTGFDNELRGLGFMEFDISNQLPTTSPDFVMMGERAAEMLFQIIETGNSDTFELILPCPLLTPQVSGNSIPVSKYSSNILSIERKTSLQDTRAHVRSKLITEGA